MDKVDVAIQRLQTASKMSLQVYEQPLIITDSGGKDSSVLVDLAIKAKIPMEIVHSHTTADAPETVRFVRDKFKRLEGEGISVSIHYPTYRGKPTSMWALIPINKFPPTRLARYCCKVLKEQTGGSCMLATGVRWHESNNRKSRGIYETMGKSKKEGIYLLSDNDDRRQLFENCQLKAKRIVNPIIDWTDADIWGYIHAEKVAHNPLYYCGFSRVGCIGCPMAGRKGMLHEFALYPAYEKLYKNAFKRMLEAIHSKGLKTRWKDENDVFAWWTEDRNLDGQINLFDEQEGGNG